MNGLRLAAVPLRVRGFTLLEVLVALAILALVMLVLGQTVGSAIDAYVRLDQKTRAWMVASDKMVEMQVYARWPAVGTQQETQARDAEQWRITTQVSNGPFAGTRRVDIGIVLLDENGKGGNLYTLTGLLGEPAQVGGKSTLSGGASATKQEMEPSDGSSVPVSDETVEGGAGDGEEASAPHTAPETVEPPSSATQPLPPGRGLHEQSLRRSRAITPSDTETVP